MARLVRLARKTELSVAVQKRQYNEGDHVAICRNFLRSCSSQSLQVRLVALNPRHVLCEQFTQTLAFPPKWQPYEVNDFQSTEEVEKTQLHFPTDRLPMQDYHSPCPVFVVVSRRLAKVCLFCFFLIRPDVRPIRGCMDGWIGEWMRKTAAASKVLGQLFTLLSLFLS